MAVTTTTLELANGLRIYVDSVVNQQTRDLVAAWARTWDNLSAEWDRTLANMLVGADKWPSATQLRRNQRLLMTLASTNQAIEGLAKNGGIRVTGDISPLVRRTATANSHLIASQLPFRNTDELMRLAQLYNRVDERALSAIVSRTTQRVTKLADTIGPRAYSNILHTLTRGVAVGENPRRAASRMMGMLENKFHGGLYRMNNIARTEMLDAHRASANEQMKANSDVLRGWQWAAELDDKTCPGCWSMHGEIFGLDTPGPEDHQQGRCAALPATRSWSDMGFDIPEPESVMPDAEETFNSLPRDSQLEIMGSSRMALLDQGAIGWSDLHTYKTNPDWRGSFVATPVSALGA